MVILILSIISLITTLIGLYHLGEKERIGFLIFTISLMCQMWIFYLQNNKYLFVQMIVLIIFNIWNYFKWKKGGQNGSS
jgi:hypothetical protein